MKIPEPPWLQESYAMGQDHARKQQEGMDKNLFQPYLTWCMDARTEAQAKAQRGDEDAAVMEAYLRGVLSCFD